MMEEETMAYLNVPRHFLARAENRHKTQAKKNTWNWVRTHTQARSVTTAVK
jgi:hypothetical protein